MPRMFEASRITPAQPDQDGVRSPAPACPV